MSVPQYLVFLHIMLCDNHLCEDAEAVMELVRAPGPHVGHRAGHLGGEEAAHYGGRVEVTEATVATDWRYLHMGFLRPPATLRLSWAEWL